MAAPAIYERLRTTGYPWKRVDGRYKNGQPKDQDERVSPLSRG